MGQWAGEAEQLEPGDEVGCPYDGLEPRLVWFPVGEGEPFVFGVLRRPLWSSTWVWARMRRSSSAGSVAWWV